MRLIPRQLPAHFIVCQGEKRHGSVHTELGAAEGFAQLGFTKDFHTESFAQEEGAHAEE